MSVSIYQLGYKKLSQIVFEWQAADRTSLLALFIVMEVFLHWLWCLLVWWNQESFDAYVNLQFLYPLWFGITIAGLLFWWMIGHLSRIKNNSSTLHKWQIVLISVYTFYITIVIVVMGYSSLVAGVTLVGGATLAMMLVRRRYVWRIFLLQILLILLAVISPYFGISLPNLRQLTSTYPLLDLYSYLTYNEVMSIENAIAASVPKNELLGWNNVSDLQRSSALFWRTTHMYMAIPKAIFIVYMFRMLLLILDNSRNEILEHAHQDELTGLKNRRYGLHQMQQTVMDNDKDDYSILLLDLDWFKSINDTYGHNIGDAVLREIADILKTSLDNPDSVSRYGGEEFLITLPNTSHSEALSIAEKLRTRIKQHKIPIDDSPDLQITVSLGLYTLTYKALSELKQQYLPITTATVLPELTRMQKLKNRGKPLPIRPEFTEKTSFANDICQKMISEADKALYQAKSQGRDQVVSANETMSNSTISSEL